MGVNNRIGDEGAKALGEALKNNTTLTILDLMCNRIGDEGGQALGEALQNNTALTRLDLERNRISYVGAKALGEGLQKNITLTSLNLGYNQLGEEGAKALAAGLERNMTLTALYLNSSQIGTEDEKLINSLITRNQRFLKELQSTALKQLIAGRILLRAASALNKDNGLMSLPQEIRIYIVEMIDENALMIGEQQRLILNYVEGKIPPVTNKLTFFKVTKCDSVRKQLKQDEVEAASCSLVSMV